MRLRPLLLAAAACTIWSGPAAAVIDPPEKRLASNYSAFALNDGETVIGLVSLSHAFTDRLEIGTIFLLDLVGAFNAAAKYTLYQDDRQAFAATVGAIYFDQDVSVFSSDDVRTTFLALPVGVSYSRDLVPDFSLHLAASYAYANLDVEYKGDSEEEAFDASGFGSGVSAKIAFEYDLARGDALYLEAEVPVLVTAQAEATSSGESSSDSETSTGFDRTSVTLSYILSWETFNLRLGAGYGPSIFDADKKGFIPELDLFWRF
ncbi:hypothetical protein L6V77_14955 [Myxococcota bacterium]|nr:hypothetical protein [Myxococcota bacterium]